jgi:hypothetical protein
MMLNVFGSDAFHFTKLVAAINLIPHQPTRLGQMGLFRPEGIDTLTVAIEMENNVLTLVPTASRGAPGVVKGLERRNLRDFRTVHLPQRGVGDGRRGGQPARLRQRDRRRTGHGSAQ